MSSWIAVVGMVAVGAITPGPNNLVVLRAAARSGPRSALPAAAGIVLGGLVLLAAAALGGDLLFLAFPWARPAIAAAGSLYLAWLGGALVAASFKEPAGGERTDPAPPAGLAALLAFQLTNPKAWTMAWTAVSSLGDVGALAAFARLAPVFVVVPALSLAAWSTAGTLLAAALRRRRVRAWFDRGMGGLLVGAAAMLLLEA